MRTTPLTINRTAAALNITPDNYINMFYNAGFEYLQQRRENATVELGTLTPKTKARLKRFTNTFLFSPAFWFWWSAETEKTDRAFLRSRRKTLDGYKYMLENRLLIPPDEVINEVLTPANIFVKTPTV